MTGQRLFKMGVQKIDTLIDVGANEGQFLLDVLGFFHPRNTVTIEMLPDLAEQLRQKVPEGVEVVQCAVGDRMGTAPVRRSVFSQASSLLDLVPEASQLYQLDLSQFDAGSVPMRTLDDIYYASGITTVDLLKIDVQGYELHVIAGASETLANSRVVMIEANFIPIYQNGSTFVEVLDSLRRHGFTLKNVFDANSSADGILLHADALFFRGGA